MAALCLELGSVLLMTLKALQRTKHFHILTAFYLCLTQGGAARACHGEMYGGAGRAGMGALVWCGRGVFSIRTSMYDTIPLA